MGARVDAKFVVTAADVLHERMTADDHPRRTVAVESTHGSESGFESAVVAFNPVVRILVSVVKCGWHEAVDRRPQRWGPVGHDFDRLTVGAECRTEESSGCLEIAGNDET